MIPVGVGERVDTDREGVLGGEADGEAGEVILRVWALDRSVLVTVAVPTRADPVAVVPGFAFPS